MNDPISWDPSLVKKYSSSNHYKLLNQLRNEVKKYPLNNKRKTLSTQNIQNNQDNRNKLNFLQEQNKSFTNISNHSNDTNSNKSTVSFNNAKNFSIYNQSNNINRKDSITLSEQSKSNDDSNSKSFTERLNQVDMK